MINVCLSGFESKEKTTLIKFIDEMADLGLRLQPGITFSVNVLVCNSSKFDKYRVAKRLNIDVVGKEWVYKCYENHTLLDTAQYLLKPFRNIKLALLGFLQSEFDKLSDFIIKNEGIIETEMKEAEIVVFKKGTSYEFELRNVNKCIVDSDWIMQCYERKHFVPTQYFEYNQKKIDPRQLLVDLQGSKIQEALNKINFQDFSYLEECVIYIAIKDENLKRILVQLISVGNGFYVTQLLPIVTHIIYLQGCSEEVNQQGVKIVHPMWLCDCFILRKRLIEEEFQVKIKLSEHQSAITSFATSQEDVQREQIILGKIPETKPFMEENNSYKFGLRSSNFSTTNSNMLAFNKFSVSNVARKTKLFEPCQIFILDHSSLDKSLFQLLSDHSALFERLSYPLKVKFSSLKISKAKQVIIFLLPDHEQCKDTITTLQNDSKQQDNIKFFSYRWVGYCVQQSKLELQITNKKLYHLQPTNQATPTENLKGKNIYVASVEVNQKIVFRELAKIVTGIECKFSLGDLDYYVSDRQGKKYKQIEEINKSIRVLNQIEIKPIDWLLSQFINQNNQI